MSFSFRKTDAVALAVGVWGMLTALPHLLWILKRECVASCIEAYPGSDDIILITQFTQEIAATGSLFSHPDPVLRYPPIALVMLVGDVIGSFDPVTVVVGYAWVWEFIVLPVTLYLAVRWVAGEWAGAAAILALVVTTHLSVPFPWPAAVFGAGNYQYVLGLPTTLLAIGATSWDDSGIWTGVLIGITANIQVALALIAALAIAAHYALVQRWRSIGIAAVLSFVLTIPTFALYATSYTGNQTTSRAFTLAGGLTLVGILLGGALAVYLARTTPDLARRAAQAPFAIAAVICAVVVLAGVIDGGWWYPYVGGYVGHTVAAAAIGTVAVRLSPTRFEEDLPTSRDRIGREAG